MSTPANSSSHRSEDEVVSFSYRQVADESAPEHLNRQVLQHARIATEPPPNLFGFHRWLQPIALVAVIGLSLTLFLEINESVETVSSPTSIGQNRNSLDKAAQTALEQIRSAESLAQPNPSSTVTDPQPAIVDPTSPSNVRQQDVSECNSRQRATTSLWWQCIQTLERRGHAEAATREYEALFSTYPAFEAP